jgi:predicted O-methyltransferase YrrM
MTPVVPLRYAAFPEEQGRLCDLMAAAPGRYAVEIGAYLGATTRVLAQACRGLGKRLIVVDPWDGTQDASDDAVYRQFLANTADLHDVLTVIRGRSADVALPGDVDGNAALVFVDGDHSYEGCLKDLIRYWKYLPKGGVLAVHDLFCPGWDAGIGRAVHEFAEQRAPLTGHHLVYYPTAEEVGWYEHGRTGLSWFFKP